ncbi:hypothetical protein [Peribacillus sp. B2I2]|uniref:hypothetical protein n=1 Tax=Peribacillus sp. B2I2 TaxID=3156468 RepID=UPI0035185413
METEKKGYIRVGHLVYIIIIALIVLSYFLVFALGDTKTASTTIGTASTVSSLILSVIAIVMTLIDVAGQRQAMVDLKETADKLQISNESAGVLFQELKTEIVDLQNTKQQMLEAVAESDEWRKEVVEKLEIVQNGDFKPEDLEKMISEVQKKDLDILQRTESIKNATRNADEKWMYYYKNLKKISISDDDVLNFIKKNFKNGDQVAISEFRKILQEKFNITLAKIEQIELNLAVRGYIRKTLDRPGTMEFNF